MAIKFEDDPGAKPAKKEVGGKTYVAEEPAADRSQSATDLPFAKPVKAEKKGRKVRQK